MVSGCLPGHQTNWHRALRQEFSTDAHRRLQAHAKARTTSGHVATPAAMTLMAIVEVFVDEARNKSFLILCRSQPRSGRDGCHAS